MGLYAVHLVVMLLGFVLFALMTYANLATMRRRGLIRTEGPPNLPLPWRLVRVAVASAVYLVALFWYSFSALGEGSPEVRDGQEVWVRASEVVRELRPGERLAFERRELRLFSAAWLFFALVIAIAGHRVLVRVRWLLASTPESEGLPDAK